MGPGDDEQEFLLHSMIHEGTIDPPSVDDDAHDEDDGSQYLNQSGNGDADQQLENTEQQDEAEVYEFHAYMYL